MNRCKCEWDEVLTLQRRFVKFSVSYSKPQAASPCWPDKVIELTDKSTSSSTSVLTFKLRSPT